MPNLVGAFGALLGTALVIVLVLTGTTVIIGILAVSGIIPSESSTVAAGSLELVEVWTLFSRIEASVVAALAVCFAVNQFNNAKNDA